MPPDFFPNSLAGTVSLVVQFCGAVSVTIAVTMRWIRRPLQEQADRDRAETDRHFKEQGERIGGVSASLATNIARIEATDRVVERLHLTQTSLSEAYGRQDARVDRLMEVVEKGNRERLDEDRQIGERLARMETQLGLLLQTNSK